MYLGEPFHIGNTIPSRHDQPERLTVVMRKRLTIHLEGQHIFFTHGIWNRETACKSLIHFPASDFFRGYISAEKHNFFCAILYPGTLQNVP